MGTFFHISIGLGKIFILSFKRWVISIVHFSLVPTPGINNERSLRLGFPGILQLSKSAISFTMKVDLKNPFCELEGIHQQIVLTKFKEIPTLPVNEKIEITEYDAQLVPHSHKERNILS